MSGIVSRTSSIRVPVREDCDVVAVRGRVRALGLQVGFSQGVTEAIATAVSEVACNIVVHAGAGEILLDVVAQLGRRGIIVVARDDGPGIADIKRAMQDGYSTGRGLGLGLSSARRLMDEFALQSAAGEGTVVTMTKWAP